MIIVGNRVPTWCPHHYSSPPSIVTQVSTDCANPRLCLPRVGDALVICDTSTGISKIEPGACANATSGARTLYPVADVVSCQRRSQSHRRRRLTTPNPLQEVNPAFSHEDGPPLSRPRSETESRHTCRDHRVPRDRISQAAHEATSVRVILSLSSPR